MPRKTKRSIQVRIDPDVAEIVIKKSRENKRSWSREVTLALARHYSTKGR